MTPYKTHPHHHPTHRRRDTTHYQSPHQHPQPQAYPRRNPSQQQHQQHHHRPHFFSNTFARARQKMLFFSSTPAACWFVLGFGTACIIKFAPQVQEHPAWKRALQMEAEEAATTAGAGAGAAGGEAEGSWYERRRKACLSHMYWKCPHTRRAGRSWGDADPFAENVAHPDGPKAWPS